MPSASLDVGPGGRIGVVWTDADEHEVHDILFAESLDGGQSFGVNFPVHGGHDGPQQFPAVAYDGDGVVHVLWEFVIPSNWDYDIYHAESRDAGVSFTVPERVNDDPLDPITIQQSVAVCRDAEGALAAVWMDGREAWDENVYFAAAREVMDVLDEGPGPPTLPVSWGGVYPNPIRRGAWFHAAEVRIYNARGACVKRIGGRGDSPAWIRWDGLDRGGRRVAAGAYWARLSAGGERITRRIRVLR